MLVCLVGFNENGTGKRQNVPSIFELIIQNKSYIHSYVTLTRIQLQFPKKIS